MALTYGRGQQNITRLRARLRVYDLCAIRAGIPCFRKMLVIL